MVSKDIQKVNAYLDISVSEFLHLENKTKKKAESNT